MPTSKNILGQKILFITAHPDDESYLISGTMHKNHERGGQSFLLCATMGEKGKSHLVKKKITETAFKKTRSRELKSVARILKISKLLILDLPDCALLEKTNQKILHQKIISFAKETRPKLIASFGKDGISGHLDHISVGQVALKVAEEMKIPFLTFCCPPKLQKTSNWLKIRRQRGLYAEKISYPSYNIRIKVNPRVKIRALKIHRSQLDNDSPFRGFSKGAAKEMLSNEYFYLSV